jgi:hypothetical protein
MDTISSSNISSNPSPLNRIGVAVTPRNLASHARGHRFDSDILHFNIDKAFKVLRAFFILIWFKHGLNIGIVLISNNKEL